jgi:hypothetical protein
MPSFPTDPLDRLAELEGTVARLEAALALYRQQGVRATPRHVWPARTAEPESDPYPDWPCDTLPIIFADLASLPAADLDWTDRSEYPGTTALSPIGWLPPDTEVEVCWDGRGYRLVRWPVLLLGLVVDGFDGAVWTDCSQLTLASGDLLMFRQDSRGIWVPAKYKDDSDVTMTAYSTSDETTPADKLVTMAPAASNEWHLILEPCGGSCTP